VIFQFDDFELNSERLELHQAGSLVDADALVIRLLARLVRTAGQLVTKEELVNDVWEGRAIADNAITVSVARLRKTLGGGRDQSKVATVYGRGYRFVGKVTALSAHVTRPAVPALSSPAARLFVGRERVLSSLQQALADAQDGRGRACLLIGEPGIGKTSSVELFERTTASKAAHVVWGYCREGGDSPPLWPWLRVLRELIGSCPVAELEQMLGPAASELFSLCSEPRASRPGTPATSLPLDMRPARDRSYDSALRTLAFAAKRVPRVIVLDDLHCADSASLELLCQLLAEIGRTRILVIATLRNVPGIPGSEALLRQVMGHRNCERLLLDRLPEDQVASYVRASLDDADGRLGKAVFAKSEGNPFFMVELCRQLRQAKQPDPERLTVDDPALELVRQRVARLDRDARGVLSAAAVIGRNFELRLLRDVTDRDAAALMSGLDDALAAEVVVSVEDSVTGFAFTHELLRAVLYDALPPAERRRWHIRIAQALEARTEQGGAVPPSELAYHYYAALPESDARKTVHYCCEAAGAASEYGNPDVVRYLRRALEALALVENPSVRLRMRLLFISSAYARGRAHGEYEQLLRELLTLAQDCSDAPMLVRAALMANPHPGFKPLSSPHNALTNALRVLKNDEPGSRAMALAALACAAPECFSESRSSALLDEAVPLARNSGSRLALYGTLMRKLYAIGGPTHRDAAAELAQELEELGQAHPRRLPMLPINLAMHRAIVALQQGDAPAMASALARAEGQSRKLCHVELIWYVDRLRAVSSINMGDRDEGMAALLRVHREAERRAISAGDPFCAFDRAVIFGEFTQLEPLAYDESDPPSVWALKLRALATAGLIEDAWSALRTLEVAELALLPCDRDYLGTLGHIARAAVLLGATDYAKVVYNLLARFPDAYAAHVSFFCEGSVQQLLGMLAQTLGRRQEARMHLEAGIQMNERAGLVLRTAEARTQLAELKR
jgi:eukaryotic-like serine/threonine-protein kinase